MPLQTLKELFKKRKELLYMKKTIQERQILENAVENLNLVISNNNFIDSLKLYLVFTSKNYQEQSGKLLKHLMSEIELNLEDNNYKNLQSKLLTELDNEDLLFTIIKERLTNFFNKKILENKTKPFLIQTKELNLICKKIDYFEIFGITNILNEKIIKDLHIFIEEGKLSKGKGLVDLDGWLENVYKLIELKLSIDFSELKELCRDLECFYLKSCLENHFKKDKINGKKDFIFTLKRVYERQRIGELNIQNLIFNLARESKLLNEQDLNSLTAFLDV